MAEEKEEKSGLKLVQVAAAALAAVTAAVLGSTLGVAGTVVGAGLASVVTTVGGELYIRSLKRTKDAALRARLLATASTRRTQVIALPDASGQEPPAESPPEEEVSWLRKLRWPIIIGTSVVAFAVALLVITGFEAVSGKSVSGEGRSTIGTIVGGGGAKGAPEHEPPAPATSTTTPPPTVPNSEPTTPSTEPSAPTSTPTTTPPPVTTTTPPPVTTTTPPPPSGGAAQ